MAETFFEKILDKSPEVVSETKENPIYSSVILFDEKGFILEEYITTKAEIIQEHETRTCHWGCPICYEEGCRWRKKQNR